MDSPERRANYWKQKKAREYKRLADQYKKHVHWAQVANKVNDRISFERHKKRAERCLAKMKKLEAEDD